MLVKTVLNRLVRFKGFVYEKVRFIGEELEILIRARRGSRPVCSRCLNEGSTYDHLEERRYRFIPLCGIAVYLVYTPRRVDCRVCGSIAVEKVPWAEGKERHATIFQQFLAHWARKLSWKEVSREFGVSWNIVYRSVEWIVLWGLRHRDLSGITAIGVDEILSWRGHKYVTMVYQIDEHCKRLLWVGKERTAESFGQFFDMLGTKLSEKIQYVCSDMWKGYLQVIRERIPNAIHVLDRFHIVANLNKALDEVRAGEARRLKVNGDDESLKRTRRCILKKPANLTKNQRRRLKELLSMNLKTVRAYLLARDFNHLWKYNTATWAGKFLNAWCSTVMRARSA